MPSAADEIDELKTWFSQRVAAEAAALRQERDHATTIGEDWRASEKEDAARACDALRERARRAEPRLLLGASQHGLHRLWADPRCADLRRRVMRSGRYDET
jgi:hypothetical protein